jgi:hypothetical protein
MGFLDDVNTGFEKLTGQPAGSASGTLGDIGKVWGGFAQGPAFTFLGGNQAIDALGRSPTPPGQPGMDPSLANLNAQRTQQAQQFRQNLPGTQTDMTNNLASRQRQDLAGDMAQNKMGANRRGLLGSGLQKAADVRSSVGAAKNLQQGGQEIATSLENTAQQMENQAIAGGLQYWQSGQALQDQAYQQALANMQSRNAGIGSLMGAGGTVAGSYYGRQNNSGGLI